MSVCCSVQHTNHDVVSIFLYGLQIYFVPIRNKRSRHWSISKIEQTHIARNTDVNTIS